MRRYRILLISLIAGGTTPRERNPFETWDGVIGVDPIQAKLNSAIRAVHCCLQLFRGYCCFLRVFAYARRHPFYLAHLIITPHPQNPAKPSITNQNPSQNRQNPRPTPHAKSKSQCPEFCHQLPRPSTPRSLTGINSLASKRRFSCTVTKR